MKLSDVLLKHKLSYEKLISLLDDLHSCEALTDAQYTTIVGTALYLYKKQETNVCK